MDPDSGLDPYWSTELGKRTALHKEIADLTASFLVQPAIQEKPAGYFTRTDTPEHEVAAYLHSIGIYSHRHRTEH